MKGDHESSISVPQSDRIFELKSLALSSWTEQHQLALHLPASLLEAA